MSVLKLKITFIPIAQFALKALRFILVMVLMVTWFQPLSYRNRCARTCEADLFSFQIRFSCQVKKKGKNQTAEDNFFVTVYFSPVSLGLQCERWRLTMKMTTAAKQAESACDSWRESDRQRSMVPQENTQLLYTNIPTKVSHAD